VNVLICGGGIAGLTLAWWLSRGGHTVVLVEKSKGARSEGYMLDFFGSGWDVARKMGLIEKLGEIHYPVSRLDFVREDGGTSTSLSYADMRRRLFKDRHFNFMRGDLERVLLEAVGDVVDVRFGTSVASFEEGATSIRVKLTDGTRASYDLLVGADGIHSSIRDLALEEGQEAERFLGFYTAAFVIADPGLSEEHAGAFRTLTVPGRQVAIYPIRGGKLATFFVHDAKLQPEGLTSPADILRAVYDGLPWVVPRLLARIPSPAEVYFDRVSQVVLRSWSRGRVTLVGDACQAVSLLAGQGASMAMGGAWALSAEIGRGGSIEQILQRYESRLKPAIEAKQRAGRRMAGWFVPATRWRIAMRDLLLRASVRPGMSWLLAGSISGTSIVE
jgi:2-polyprenyl-6-methoxyphenol hydroxylase-like FAD-dependent oxidoreductase